MINILLTELIFCWQSRNSEQLKVESAIMITRKHCVALSDELFRKTFTSDEEEIFFFKKIEPNFIGKLRYYTILYEALISESCSPHEYWSNEMKRYSRFREKNASFIEYLESGCTVNDDRYFLRRNNKEPIQLHQNLYGLGANLHTSHNHVASALFAEKLYNRYVSHKIS